jgi:hypothetical protein
MIPTPGTKVTIMGFKNIPEKEFTVRTVEKNRTEVTITFDAYVPKHALPQIRFAAAVGILRKLLSHPQQEDREERAINHATMMDLSCGGPMMPSKEVYEHAVGKLLALNLCPGCGTHGQRTKLKPSKRHKRKQFCSACGWSEKGWIFI